METAPGAMSTALNWPLTKPSLDVPPTVQKLNARLLAMHGPTTSVASTLASLATFPTQIGSLRDADILDMSFALEPIESSAETAVAVRVRYRTMTSMATAFDFYTSAFQAVTASFASVIDTAEGTSVAFEAQLGDRLDTDYRVNIYDLGECRTVIVRASYRAADLGSQFECAANWHNDHAPSGSTGPAGFEVYTVDTGESAMPLAVYTTRYQLPGTPLSTLRSKVHERLLFSGWGYTERYEGILLLQGDFLGEAHVLGDEHGSTLDFVGEFDLTAN